MEQSGNQTQVKRVTSALADVDTTGWTQRFDLLSDPNRLEILLCLHRAPGIFVGDLAAALGRSENAVSQALRVLRQQAPSATFVEIDAPHCLLQCEPQQAAEQIREFLQALA